LGIPRALNRFLQQLDEHRRRFRLLLRGDMLDDGQDRSFDQHAQHRIGICTDLAGHADRLSEDIHRIRLAGGNALNAAD
jgi:hypothetical protein